MSEKKSFALWLQPFIGFIIGRIAKYTYGKMIVRQYKVKYVNQEIFKELKPPYLLLSNHMNTFDPVQITLGIKEYPHWVSSDWLFRNPFQSYVLRSIGLIPKMKGVSDMETVKDIIRCKERKEVVALFPEGERSWNGSLLPLLPGTYKIIRLLKIPVVTVTMKGGYLILPRWSWEKRDGSMEVEYKLTFSGEEIKKLPLSEIQTRLDAAMSYDEFENQKQRKIIFKSDRRAEHIENLLFTCPSCESIATLVSHENNLTCKSCGYDVFFDEYTLPVLNRDQDRFSSIREWDLWQQEFMKERFNSLLAEDSDTLLLSDTRIEVLSGEGRKPLKHYKTVQLSLYTDRLEFLNISDSEDKEVFLLKSVTGFNVVMQQYLEFLHNRTMYSFRFPSRKISAYKWLIAHKAITTLQQGVDSE